MTASRSSLFSDRSLPMGRITLGALLVFCLFLLLRNAGVAAEGMREGLSLCARAVVPALFPSLVLCEALLRGELLQRPLCALSRPIARLLGLCEAGAEAVLLGLLCGFPVGARAAIRAYDRGRIDACECERVFAASGPPSLAFVFGVAAPAVSSARGVGLALCLSVWGSSLLVSILWRLVLSRDRIQKSLRIPSPPSPTPPPAKLLTDSVKAATESMLLICAYVVLFTTLCDTLERILSPMGLSETLRAILIAPLELSTGILRAATLPSATRACLCASLAAWSGVSIHCQLLSLIDRRPIPIGRYLLAKGAQALLSPLLFSLMLRA